MLFPTLGRSSLSVVVTQPDERHANRTASVLESIVQHLVTGPWKNRAYALYTLNHHLTFCSFSTSTASSSTCVRKTFSSGTSAFSSWTSSSRSLSSVTSSITVAQKKLKNNQKIFFYCTLRITSKCVTSMPCPNLRHSAKASRLLS